MRIKELRTKSKKELSELLKKERASIALFHFQSEKGRSKNVKSARESRRLIARIHTLLKE